MMGQPPDFDRAQLERTMWPLPFSSMLGRSSLMSVNCEMTLTVKVLQRVGEPTLTASRVGSARVEFVEGQVDQRLAVNHTRIVY